MIQAKTKQGRCQFFSVHRLLAEPMLQPCGTACPCYQNKSFLPWEGSCRVLWLEGWDDVSHVLKSHRDLAALVVLLPELEARGATPPRRAQLCAAPRRDPGQQMGRGCLGSHGCCGVAQHCRGARCAGGVRRRRSDLGSARSTATLVPGPGGQGGAVGWEWVEGESEWKPEAENHSNL